MTAYEIKYKVAGRINEASKVVIYTCDYLDNDERINDILGVIKRFEELAEKWGTYENRNAIVKIEIL